MTYSALFCSEVNKLYVLLHAKLFSHTRTARWYAAMRAAHHHARTSAAPSVLRWSRWRPALLIYTHLRLQHWDIFSWSIRILRCPWCCFFGSDSDTFLIHKFFGAFLAPPQQLVVGRCWCLLSKGYFITSSVFLAIKKATHFLAWVVSWRWDSLRERFYSSPSFLATMMLLRCSASIIPPSILNSRKASSISFDENFSPQVISECLNLQQNQNQNWNLKLLVSVHEPKWTSIHPSTKCFKSRGFAFLKFNFLASMQQNQNQLWNLKLLNVLYQEDLHFLNSIFWPQWMTRNLDNF